MMCISGAWSSPRRRARAGGVEVAQRTVMKLVGAVKPVEDALKHVLGFAVGAAGYNALILVNRHALRIVEEVGRRRDNHPPHAVFHRAAKEIDAAEHIVAHILERLLHGFTDKCVGGEVHDCIRPMRRQRGVNCRTVVQVPLHKDGVRVYSRAVPLVEVIEDDDLLACRDKFLHHNGTDIACTASDQYFHGLRLSLSGSLAYCTFD